MRYSVVLFDFDHTLFDFDASEQAALATVASLCGQELTPEFEATYRAINRELWQAVERHELVPDEVHQLRFERFVDQLRIDVDPAHIGAAFLDGLATVGELHSDAEPVLDDLGAVARLGVVTNAISEVQRRRIERLDLAHRFDAIVISSEIGVMKPAAAIFEHALAELGDPPKTDVLMVGDSLSSDIRGGANAGIDTCWFAPGRADDAPGIVTHHIDRLTELPAVVRG